MPPVVHLLTDHTIKLKTMRCGVTNPAVWTCWFSLVTCPRCKIQWKDMQ